MGGGVAPPVQEKLHISWFRKSFEKIFQICECFSIFQNIDKKNFGKFLFKTVKTAPKVAVQHPPIDPQGFEKN